MKLDINLIDDGESVRIALVDEDSHGEVVCVTGCAGDRAAMHRAVAIAAALNTIKELTGGDPL